MAPWLLPGVIAAGQIGSQAYNNAQQGKMNRQTRAWNERMWQYNRDAALQDWNMMNEYNHPSAQMKRLREAGINPHTVYGQGSVATTTNQPRAADGGGWNPRPPTFDFAGPFSQGLGAFYNTQMKDAQIDNLRKQNTVLDEDKALKQAQVIATLATAAKTGQDTEMSKFDLAMKSRLQEISAEMASVTLDRAKQDMQLAINADERAAALNASNLKEAVERILKMRAEKKNIDANTQLTKEKTQTEFFSRSLIGQQHQEIDKRIELMDKDGQLKQLDINLKKMGIQPGDEMYWRILGQLIQSK